MSEDSDKLSIEKLFNDLYERTMNLELHSDVTNMMIQHFVIRDRLYMYSFFISLVKKFPYEDIKDMIDNFNKLKDELKSDYKKSWADIMEFEEHYVPEKISCGYIEELWKEFRPIIEKTHDLQEKCNKLEELFLMIWQFFDEEAEIPAIPIIPPLELYEKYNPKDHDKWKNSI